MPNYEDTNPADFEEVERTELGIETSPNGQLVTIKGQVRRHSVWIQRDASDPQKLLYTAIVDDYEPIHGEDAIAMFDKYLELAKYKSKL